VTANSTARLGLIAPVDSDLFLSADFTSTFTKLDNAPGIFFVDNYAGLASLAAGTLSPYTGPAWGIPQHGNKVMERDNGAEWYWYNPSGSGVWKRSNSIGLLNSIVQSAPVTTTLKTTGGPTFITSGNFTVPGGRPVHVHLNMGLDNSSGVGGIAIITIKDNGTQIAEYNYRVGSLINVNGANVHAHVYLNSLANNSTHNITAQIRSANISAAVGGAGTSVARVSTLTVHEL
jgi:hypothetical protein